MEFLSIIIIVISFIFYLLKNIHIYQLNYYKPEVQNKWLKTNKTLILINACMMIVISMTYYFKFMIAFLILAILLFLYNFPKKAKIKLVFTPRVKRMLGEIAAIIAVLMFILFLFSLNYYFYTFSFIFILIPWLLLFVDYTQKPLNKRINQWYINDAKKMLEQNPDLLVIGITGSYGKTSMKYFLTEFLSTKYEVLMTPGNLNTTLGVVRTIRENLKVNHEIFVCEMGATKSNDIKEICNLVNPKHGIITSIGPQHLESFKTIENVIGTKFELADSLPEDGYLFLNYDNEYIANKKDSHQIVSYGVDNKKSDYKVTDIKVSGSGLSFKVNKVNFTTRLIGKHNILNILGAMSVAETLGVKLKDLVEIVRRLEPVPHRLELKEQHNRIIIDDAYNSNPMGAKYALEALSEFKEIKVLMTPGMVELGEKEDFYNREFGENAASVCDYVILVNENQTKAIYSGLINKKFNKEKIFVVKNIEEGFQKLNEINKYGKLVVLLENDLPDQY